MKELYKPVGNIIRRTAELPLDAWNCVVPRKAILTSLEIGSRSTEWPLATIGTGIVDGGTLAFILNEDIKRAIITSACALVIHFAARRSCGDWRQNCG